MKAEIIKIEGSFFILKEITFCEVCNNKNLLQAIAPGLHSLCDDLIEIGRYETPFFAFTAIIF
jgi:hypothetical protein